MKFFHAWLSNQVAPMCFGLCSAEDVAAVHVAGLEREETAGARRAAPALAQMVRR